MVPRMRRGTLRRQMQRHKWVRARVGRVADRDRVLVIARALVVGRVVVTILPVAALVAVGLLRPVGLVLSRTRNCVLCNVDEVDDADRGTVNPTCCGSHADCNAGQGDREDKPPDGHPNIEATALRLDSADDRLRVLLARLAAAPRQQRLDRVLVSSPESHHRSLPTARS